MSTSVSKICSSIEAISPHHHLRSALSIMMHEIMHEIDRSIDRCERWWFFFTPTTSHTTYTRPLVSEYVSTYDEHHLMISVTSYHRLWPHAMRSDCRALISIVGTKIHTSCYTITIICPHQSAASCVVHWQEKDTGDYLFRIHIRAGSIGTMHQRSETSQEGLAAFSLKRW